MVTDRVGLDSQCYTYLVEVMSDLRRPSDALAAQRIALFRVFLYRRDELFISRTVRREFEAITDSPRADLHEDWTSLVSESQPIDLGRIDKRARDLNRCHSDLNDCLILAEGEDASFDTLLTFDADFISRLSRHTPMALRRPAEYWEGLAIPRGAAPFTGPRVNNPMSQEAWWRWV